ncbi:hypothetical protein SDC9_179278 [bioreactor metagenome]|uniref:Uncharacterized protein n=1 Tax=bioreactor metagenome TaxID=1076179 RepID=A0A645H7L6_9ZZZZ
MALAAACQHSAFNDRFIGGQALFCPGGDSLVGVDPLYLLSFFYFHRIHVAFLERPSVCRRIQILLISEKRDIVAFLSGYAGLLRHRFRRLEHRQARARRRVALEIVGNDIFRDHRAVIRAGHHQQRRTGAAVSRQSVYCFIGSVFNIGRRRPHGRAGGRAYLAHLYPRDVFLAVEDDRA